MSYELLFALLVSISDTFALANNLYNEGKYEHSLEKYEYIVSTGVKNHILYYNVGNCYFKLGKIGKAILFYKRAQKLKPGDADIDFNLNFARARRVDELKTYKPPKVIKVLLNLLKSPNINILLIVSSILYFGLVFIICLSLFIKILWERLPSLENLIKTLRLGLSIVLVIVLAVLFSNLGQLNKREGVLLEQSAELRSGPSEEHTLICTIHEGMEMRILEEESDWLKITLPNDILGWVKTNQVGKI